MQHAKSRSYYSLVADIVSISKPLRVESWRERKVQVIF